MSLSFAGPIVAADKSIEFYSSYSASLCQGAQNRKNWRREEAGLLPSGENENATSIWCGLLLVLMPPHFGVKSKVRDKRGILP